MQDQVRRFLLFLKSVAAKQGIEIIPREGTRETLKFLGWTKRNLEETVLSLSVLDFSKVEKDRTQGGEVWVFGHRVEPYELYIKLKVTAIEGQVIAKCLSFHIAREPMKCPFKDMPGKRGKEGKP